MSKQYTNNTIKSRLLRRGLAGILSLALLLGLLPSTVLSAKAASWADSYVETLVDWGVMRGDIGGNMEPDRSITRAEFVAMMNRAYGYTKLGGHPFADVSPRNWYNDDIDIGYNIGYFKGTSPTTASPNATLTREQAAVLLARNMMLQPTVGETLGFSDSRTLSDWSRGLVGAAAANGIIGGYDDGTFQPFKNITRGEVAAMLVRAIGTPINTAGDHALGNVYGNVTVNTSGVKLRDGVIVGNLYLTGGIDLGEVLLENVTVLGEIIVSGGGESNSSESSVIMRNVVADSMTVDSIGDQFVTIRAEGNTDIPITTVRTNAYVDDSSLAGFGLSSIVLDGDEGALYQLAGSIKEVVNRTPGSDMQIVQGSAGKVTVDENATNSSVLVDGDARVDNLNLDVAASVTGTGDIKNLNVGAAGSTVAQLPDKITIRPGITADINGGAMNSTQASESSSDPRLLAGYPAVRKIAPTSAELVFRVNKPGTIYWAVSAVADGSVSETNLMNPPVYGGNILSSGTITATAANTDYTAAVSGLTRDGSYYVTAMLVDGRDQHSPIKVTSFSTPDDTVPAFSPGYPIMTKVSTEVAQVTVMTNKSCQLYYALLPAGSTAPTPAEFKSAAVTGNLGYGTQAVTKNVTTPINVNNVPLEEKTNYVLYLWLTDYDGAKSSSVVPVPFTTPDETPPKVTDILQTGMAASTATVAYKLDEPGGLIWAIVTESVHGEKTFLKYTKETWTDKDHGILTFADNTDLLTAKVQLESGVGARNNGRAPGSPFTIDRLLTQETNTNSYILYYVGVDTAGNTSKDIRMLRIRTLDTTAPTVEQHFTKYNGSDDTKDPLADTGIRLEFSESVQGGASGDNVFLDVYNDLLVSEGKVIDDPSQNNINDLVAKRQAWSNMLKTYVKLYRVPSDGRPTEVKYRDNDNEDKANDQDWVVDFRNAQILSEEGKTVLYLPTTSPDEDTNKIKRNGLNLESGARYRFRLDDIFDCGTPLRLNESRYTDLTPFTTVYAQVILSAGDQLLEQTVKNKTESGTNITADPERSVRMDTTFYVEPESTSKVAESEHWDMILWSDTPVSLYLYRRDVTTPTPAETTWTRLNDKPVTIPISANSKFGGISLYGEAIRKAFPLLHDESSTAASKATYMEEGHKYQYGVRFTKVGNNGLVENSPSEENPSWGNLINMRVAIIAGNTTNLQLVAADVNRGYDTYTEDGSVKSIGQYYPPNGDVSNILSIRRQFTDSTTPKFESDHPRFEVSGSTAFTMYLQLTRPGTIYYAVAEAGTVATLPSNSTSAYINRNNDGSVFENVSGASQMDLKDITTAIETNKEDKDPEKGMSSLTDKTYIPTGGADKAKWGNAAELGADNVKIADSYSLPSSQSIFNPSFPASVQTGSVPYNNVEVPVKIEGLKSSSDRYGTDVALKSVYYVYFVIQGTGNAYSDVEVYRVTMNDPSVPTIQVETTSYTTAKMTPSDNSDVSYALVEYNDLPNFIRGTFEPDNSAGSAGNYDYGEMSVLQAMMRTVSGSGMSIFDRYAKSTDKVSVLEYIQGSDTQGGSATASNRSTVTNANANVAISREFKQYMSTSSNNNGGRQPEFVLLAAARHVDGGKTGVDYGYGASRSLVVRDEVPPEFTDTLIQLNYDHVYESDSSSDTTDVIKKPVSDTDSRIAWMVNPTLYYYSGSITITFGNKEVYCYDTSTSKNYAVIVDTRKVAKNLTDSPNNTTGQEYRAIGDLLGGVGGGTNSKFKLDNPKTTKTRTATRSFTLYFDKLGDGDEILLFDTGLISNASSATTGSVLRLKFNAALMSSDYNGSNSNNPGYVAINRPGFTVTWG